MTTLEEKLGYTFQSPELLENALTHSSCANESRGKLQSNERLEFLGDSILGMVVADHLYRNHPDLPEGELTRTRAALVCEESLVEVAQALGLGEYLKLGKGEEAGLTKPRDYKTALQELVQRESGQVLAYQLVGEEGPDHDKRFFVEVDLNGTPVGSGQGRSKKEAEQMAAKAAIGKLGG